MLYTIIKNLAQYVMPALAVLDVSLAAIWGLPYTTQILATISAITLFLGVIQGLFERSNAARGKQYDGALVIDKTDSTKDTYSLEVTTPLSELGKKMHIVLKVENLTD
jgi:hypothetical protein